MEYFILMILVAASLQGAVKLSLLPRRFRYSLAVMTVAPLFLMEKRVAAMNLQHIAAYLNDGNNLIDLCTLVVVQELLAIAVGISLLGEIELGGKRHYWKYAALLPSLLMPATALYLQAMAFNYLTRCSFTVLTLAVAAGYASVVTVLAEIVAVARNSRLERIASAFNASVLLLLLAVFLPVVANSRVGSRPVAVSVTARDLFIIAVAVVSVLLIAMTSYLIKTIMEKKQKS